MKAAELRQKDVAELKRSLSTLWRKHFKLKLLKASGELEKTHQLKELRREIATTLTVLTEKEGAK